MTYQGATLKRPKRQFVALPHDLPRSLPARRSLTEEFDRPHRPFLVSVPGIRLDFQSSIEKGEPPEKVLVVPQG